MVPASLGWSEVESDQVLSRPEAYFWKIVWAIMTEGTIAEAHAVTVCFVSHAGHQWN